ncbi:MAG: tetratricopeptide repeat protein [Bacteroidetes bacterium]|nr:tetratricopeptide repeat protein [Bacteroidota bacterium]
MNYIKAISHKNISQFDSARVYFELAKTLAAKVSDEDLIIKNNVALADTYFRLGLAESAEQLLLEQKKILEGAGGSFNLASVHNNLAAIYSHTGQTDKAMFHFFESIAYFEKVNDFRQLGVLYANIGNLNLGIRQYKKAYELYLRALQNSRKVADIRQEAVVLINLGVVCRSTDSTAKAVEYYEQALELLKELGDKGELARTYFNLANIFVDKDETLEGLKNYKLSLKLSKETGGFMGALYNHYSIGRAYQKLQQLELALAHYDTVSQLLRQSGNPEFEQIVQYAIQSVHAQMGNPGKAYPYLLEAYRINDSLLRSGNQLSIAELQAKYDKALEEAKALKLEQDVLRQRNVIRLWVIIALVILVLSALLAIRLTMQRRKSDLLALKTSSELERTQLELDFKRRELVNNAIDLANTKEKLGNFERGLNETLKKLPQSEADHFRPLRNQLRQAGQQNPFSEFEKRFDAVNEQFNAAMIARHPDLSPSELRMCGLLKLGLSSKEIAGITNRTVRTVENSRSIIRKKLSLSSDDNLVTYLSGIL